ncbi:hypothetical protein F52700_7440 [Fusarium sp. NRRL 52700]|nr:hypothetical protein F52700_7440 [Fusarium sp. NRRL 52700]
MINADPAKQASETQAMTAEVDAVVKKFGFNSQDHYIATLDLKLAMLQEALNDGVGTALVSKENWNISDCKLGDDSTRIIKAVKAFQDTLSAVQALVTIDTGIQTTGITADIEAPNVY